MTLQDQVVLTANAMKNMATEMDSGAIPLRYPRALREHAADLLAALETHATPLPSVAALDAAPLSIRDYPILKPGDFVTDSGGDHGVIVSPRWTNGIQAFDVRVSGSVVLRCQSKTWPTTKHKE